MLNGTKQQGFEGSAGVNAVTARAGDGARVVGQSCVRPGGPGVMKTSKSLSGYFPHVLQGFGLLALAALTRKLPDSLKI